MTDLDRLKLLLTMASSAELRDVVARASTGIQAPEAVQVASLARAELERRGE